MISLSAEQLRRAASIKDEIESLETELGRLLGSSDQPGKRGRKRMSAAGRAAIAAAQKLRWAKLKGTGKRASKGRRKMSPAARAKIAAAARARWKKAKAAGRNTL